MKTRQMQKITILLIVLNLLLASCAASATTPVPSTPILATPSPKATGTPIVNTSTPTIGMTPTHQPSPTSENTAAPVPTEDWLAETTYLDTLMHASAITRKKSNATPEGSYLYLPEFGEEYQKREHVELYETGETPTIFFLRTQFHISRSTDKKDDTGCGFAFHVKDNQNFYLLYISPNGFFQLNRYLHGKEKRIVNRPFTFRDPLNYQVTLNLTVMGNDYAINIKEVKIATEDDPQSFVSNQSAIYKDSTGPSSGKLNYAFIGGKSSNVICNFFGTGLWTFPETSK